MTTTPDDLKAIVKEAGEAYQDLLLSYGGAMTRLIDKWTGDDWSPDDETTEAIVEAIKTTSTSAGTGVGLTRQWLQVASELGDDK